MSNSVFDAEQAESLREPWDWRDLAHEPRTMTSQKISKARELGVISVLFTKRQVTERTKDLAKLEHTLRNGHIDETVYGSILKGGVQFTVPFFMEMSVLSPRMNPQVDYFQGTRYGKSQQGGRLQVVRPFSPKTDFADKLLMLVDDVTDEGITLEGTREMALDPELCVDLGEGITGPASEVGAIVLGDKRIAQYEGFDPDLVLQGFWLPNAWAGGMGLDGPNEAMRWIPELVLTGTQHEKYREKMPEILDILGPRAVMGMNDINWITT